MIEVAWFKDELSGKACKKDPSALLVGEEGSYMCSLKCGNLTSSSGLTQTVIL